MHQMSCTCSSTQRQQHHSNHAGKTSSYCQWDKDIFSRLPRLFAHLIVLQLDDEPGKQRILGQCTLAKECRVGR